MINIPILYEDENLIAFNKPTGVLVHPTASSSEETVVDWLLENRPVVRGVGDDPKMRPGIVHRLDRSTSGVLLVAKTQKYFEYLKSLFQNHQVRKTYLALVYGRVQSKTGRIDKPIGLKSGSVKRTVISAKAKMVKSAVTNYRVKRYVGDYSVLEVAPESGRTHQIRVHLASIGHPVVGDPLYGGKRGKISGPFYLHAYILEFPVAPGRILRIEADPPPELAGKLKTG